MYARFAFLNMGQGTARRLMVTMVVVMAAFSTSTVQATSPYLPAESQCMPTGTSPYIESGNYLFTKSGLGTATSDLNSNGHQDLVHLTYSLSIGSINGSFSYSIGWDLDSATGSATSWSTPLKSIPGFSHQEIYDVGVELADINGNGTPDLIAMAYAERTGEPVFVYRIAWDVNAAGTPTGFSDLYEIDGVGTGEKSYGAGVAIRDFDNDGTPDIVLMAYGRGSFRYRIGWDLDASGQTAVWEPNYVWVRGMGGMAGGADLAFADIDLDGNEDLILVVYNTEDERNIFRYKIGWNVNTSGRAGDWSRWFQLKGHGSDKVGTGLEYFYHRESGPRLIMSTHHAPQGSRNKFRYTFLPIMTSGAYFGKADDRPPRVNNQLSVPTSNSSLTPDRLFNLNMMDVRTVANEAIATLVFGCWLSEVVGNPSVPVCRCNYPNEEPSYASLLTDHRYENEIAPDALVASVAHFVDYYMGYASDNINSYVLNTYHDLNYYAGAEKIPAYYTIHYTDPTLHEGMIDALESENEEWALIYNDGKRFHGDCEDFAILRHALLRALGFDRNYIWVAGSPGHAFNVVLYRGVYRIMDYGPIFRNLDGPSGITTDIRSAWNTNSGPTRSTAEKEVNFYKRILRGIYPDRCNGGAGWAFSRQANPDIP